MKSKSIPIYVLFVVAVVFFPFTTKAQLSLDIESGAVIAGYNNVRIPGDAGTLFSLTDDLNAIPAVFYRLRAGYTIKSRHTVFVLYAPLTVKSDGTATLPIDFEGITFPINTTLDASYTFNSYRITYRYDFVKKPGFEFGLGFTAKIRDAEIALKLYKRHFVEANMNNPVQIKKYIEDILQNCRLAVLATEAHGQPHASLIAITPIQGFRQIIFATYRNTRKFENILHNGRVAVLIQGEDLDSSNQQKGFALTGFGNTQEIGISELEDAVHAHLERHPDLVNFLSSGDLALIRIKVEEYQVVRGIDDVIWWPVEDSY